LQNVLETLLLVDNAKTNIVKVEKARAFQSKATCQKRLMLWQLYIDDIKESLHGNAIPEGEMTLEEKFEDVLVNHRQDKRGSSCIP
jgi:hypothetical protein